jgi:hypothetical protein
MRLAEQEGERHHKNLVIEVVVDVQDPVAPVFRALGRDERPHDNGGVIAGFREIVHRGATSIDHDAVRIGAVKIELSHVPPPEPAVLPV